MFQGFSVALCATCLGIGLLGVIGNAAPVLSLAEDNLGLHLLYQLRGVEKPEAEVIIVAIDRKSAKSLNLPTAPQKWPRVLHARLLDQLIQQGAAVVAFDLIFYDPQKTADDEAFASAIRRAGNVVLTQPIDRETLPLFDRNNLPISRLSIEKMVSAIPMLADAAIGQAPFPLPKVPVKLNQYWRFSPGSGDMPTLPVVVMHLYAKDAFKHFLTLLKKVDPQAAATLPAAGNSGNTARHILDMIRPLYLLFKQDTTLANRMDKAFKKQSTEVVTSKTGKRVRAFISLYGSGSSCYLNFYGPPRTMETVSYHELLDPIDAQHGQDNKGMPPLHGKVVFVGQTESDWFKANDGFHTAFTEDTGLDISGVEVAATAFANLMEDKVVHPFGLIGHSSILLGWGVVCGLIAIHFSNMAATAGLLLLNGAYLAFAHLQFKSGGIWYPLVVPLLVQTPTAYIVGLAWKYRKVNTERRNIREAFGYYLPDEVVKQLASNTKALSDGGQVLYSICLFTDAESYTALSERLDPEGLTHLMNSYYETIFKPIKENDGLILQVVGDSVLAIWAAPEPKNHLKVSACQAAIGITEEVKRFNARAGKNALPTRIGIHAGKILLGNIGAMDHFEYRPVGDIVNTASRLEGLNKFLGTRVLASNAVMSVENGQIVRPVGRFVFKGKSKPVQVNELISGRNEDMEFKRAVCQNFNLGLQAFERQQWDDAEAHFFKALKIDSQDGPSKFYSDLCNHYRSEPPAHDWNGAVHLSKK